MNSTAIQIAKIISTPNPSALSQPTPWQNLVTAVCRTVSEESSAISQPSPHPT